MRQLGTLPDADTAGKLAGYLQSQSIETRLEESPQGCVLWVCDEDKVARAREIVQHFQQHPGDERYRHVPRVEPVKEDKPQPRAGSGDAAWSGPSPNQFTFSLIVLSVLITALFHSPPQQPLVGRYAFITEVIVVDGGFKWHPEPPLREVRSGEVWRLVTPIFIHFDVFHLVFNMLWLFGLGSQIEKRAGSARLALLVLLIAVGSNLCQYLFSEVSASALLERLNPWGPAVENPPPIVILSSPAFGGMSGVVFGLFGCVWIRSIYEPGCGLYVSPMNALLLLGWLLVCMTGKVGPIANVAHLVGLSMGMLLGYAVAWRNGFGRRREN